MGCRHYYRQKQPQGIDQGMTLAAFDFFVAVKAHILVLSRHLDTLTISTGGRGIIFSPLLAAFPGAKGIHEIGPHPLLAPATKVVIDGHATAQVSWHHAPLAAGFVDIENAIDNAPTIKGVAGRVHRVATWVQVTSGAEPTIAHRSSSLHNGLWWCR